MRSINAPRSATLSTVPRLASPRAIPQALPSVFNVPSGSSEMRLVSGPPDLAKMVSSVMARPPALRLRRVQGEPVPREPSDHGIASDAAEIRCRQQLAAGELRDRGRRPGLAQLRPVSVVQESLRPTRQESEPT